jgi:hypothetical protein
VDVDDGVGDVVDDVLADPMIFVVGRGWESFLKKGQERYFRCKDSSGQAGKNV